MDPRIQIGDIVYFTSSDGSKTVGLDDPTSFSVNHENDYLEVKFTLKMLKNTDIQNFVNRCLFRICASKDKEGQQIRYDDKACFMLASSQELITATQTPEDFMAFNKIELKPYNGDPRQQPYTKEFSWKFKPQLKHRKSGGYVYQNDKVSIETCMDSGGFLTPMSNRKLACGIKEYDFKVKCFYDIEELQL